MDTDQACNNLQVLTPADDAHHINKHNFKVPFVCGCRNLGEALRRISEGAAMIRTKVCAHYRQSADSCTFQLVCVGYRSFGECTLSELASWQDSSPNHPKP